MDFREVERQGYAVFGLRQAIAEFIAVFGYDQLHDRVDEIFENVAAHIAEEAQS